MANNDIGSLHVSVLLDETLSVINAAECRRVIDATLGLGGHSRSILENSPDVHVLGIDQDNEALRLASERLGKYAGRFVAVHGNFRDVAGIAAANGFANADAVIADLGVSSIQLDDAERGFSFRFDAPLDMRMDAGSGEPTVAEYLEHVDETELADVIYRYGEERRSRKIARWIVNRRNEGRPIRTTAELADLVERAVPRQPASRIHPATRTFQALRIAVNRELEALESFITGAVETLRPGGVVAIITFHSLEDRIVKNEFRRLSGKCVCPPRMPICTCGAVRMAEIVTRKPLTPGEAEIGSNPRSRSAKLRALKKLDVLTH